MTVLKSLDLKGNKQSYAGWISNLSPCDTPFVSMIGKEGIDQTQYSWQLDALDTPKNTAHEEGSLVEPEKREPTHILHNFTSIVRKVAHVSDTVASMSTHGRGKEMEYQMGKAGKELKRDMEFMCLNNGEGNIGTGNMASKFSGFAALCAPDGYVDLSTGAVTHKAITVGDMVGPWFKASDLFDLTYNLYLAGSKANKIMFHPCHATTFSDFLSNNVEAGQVYRMFDNVDTRYNAQVTKIRDPLGQKYDLIPNRFMPKSKIYIFNESDWTQMILRAPSATKLAKKGSSDRFMIESEIGLRHRHINASGVLDMDPSTLLMEWTGKPTPLTWGLGPSADIAEITIKHRATGIPVEGGTVVNWSSSNEAVLELTDSTGHTAVGTGEATNLLKPLRPGTSVVTATCGDGSASYLVTVGNPNIKLTMSNSLAEKGQTVLAVVQVLNADGTPVKDGITVNFQADPSSLVELGSISAPTTGASGTAQVTVKAQQKLGLVQLQANVGLVKSNYAKLEIVNEVRELSMRIDRRVIARGINDSTDAVISVINAQGNPIPNQKVSILSTDATVVNSPHSPVDTGATGIATVRLTANDIGESTIAAQFEAQKLDLVVAVTAPDIVLAGPGNFVIGQEFNMTTTVKRSDGSPVSGVSVDFKSMPDFAPAVSADTNAQGVATGAYTSMNNSDYEVTAEVGRYKSNTINIAGPELTGGVWKAPEILTRPVAIGGTSKAKVVLSGSNGMPLKNAVVKWTVEPAGVITAASATTTTDQNGMSLLEMTGVSKGLATASYECEGEVSKATYFHVGQGTTKNFIHSPLNPKINENIVFTAIIRRDEDNAPVVGADVTFECGIVGGFPQTVKTDASGVATLENFFPDVGVYEITASAPEYSHVKTTTVNVVEPDTSTDTPYAMTFVGNSKRVTHDTPQTITITTKAMLWGSAALGLRLDVRSLDPHIAVATLNDIPSTSQGKHTFTVKGNGPGVARIQFKARNNAGGWIDVPVTVGSPTLDVIVSPTVMTAGTVVEIAAVYKDCDGGWVPGMDIRWEHPRTMFNGQQMMPVQTTDQFGRTFHSNKAGAWDTHIFRAVLASNDAIRSIDKSIRVHM